MKVVKFIGNGCLEIVGKPIPQVGSVAAVLSGQVDWVIEVVGIDSKEANIKYLAAVKHTRCSLECKL